MPTVSGGTNITNTGQVADGVIATADLADESVTQAKMADGTQGGIPYYTTAGEWAELPAGTAGQILQSQGAGANPRWIDARGTAVAFDELFPGANRELNGDNGWTVRAGTTGVATNTLLRIASNYVETIGATASFAMRALDTVGHAVTTFPWAFSCDVGMLNTGRAYAMIVTLGATLGAPGTSALFVSSGISVRLTRSDHTDTTSDLSVYDGDTLVAQKTDVGFDYAADVSFLLSIAVDGSGSVVIYDGAGLTGTSDTLSWTTRAWDKGKGGYMGFNIGTNFTDGAGGVNRPKIDTISFDYVKSAA